MTKQLSGGSPPPPSRPKLKNRTFVSPAPFQFFQNKHQRAGMSAPIDDLLYGGDDSGDEDEMNTPLRSYSGVPLSGAAVTPPGALLASAPLEAPLTKPLTPPTMTPVCPIPKTQMKPPTSVKQAPGSGQQMFQQMFALLKQMLPMEQYAMLHSEMRKGNGNDIKSIVDIIKRIAGDAIFSSVIQKMDLTRTFPTANTPGACSGVKPEPGAAAGTVGMTASAVTSTTAASPKPTTIAPAVMPVAMPASIAAATGRSMPLPGTVSTLPAKMSAPGVKLEQVGIAATLGATATLPMTSSSNTQSRNEALEKIVFAKRLLSHAATCSLAHGVCQVKKCDDVRRVFKHSVSCGGTNGCSHCEQLKGLVKYHAKECAVGIVEHCSIPFCDSLRRSYAQMVRGVDSDDDDDNTPLSSALNKSKKHATVKSPGRGAAAQPLKRKGSNPSLTRTNSSGSPGPSLELLSSNAKTSGAVATTFSSPAVAKPQQKNVTANMTQEYGRLLQLILHVEKCTTSICPVGRECAESKAIMKQMSFPNPPARAKTYKQVYGHYKTCVAKNNTGNCPMCKIGLLPVLPASSPTLLPHLGVKTTIAPSINPIPAGMIAASSPSGGLNKRGINVVSPTPRSPLKKPRMNSTGRGKPTMAEVAPQIIAASDLVSQELAQASVTDIRKEGDVLTHTNIKLDTERRIMMEGGVRRVRMAEQLPCQKEEWVEKDLFNSEKLRTQIREAGRRSGVELGAQSSEVMAYALHEYLKQVMEEMVEIAKQRGDSQAKSLEALQKVQRVGAIVGGRPGNRMELSATDILRVSCEDSFSKLRQEDIGLRLQLLEDARREEQIEKERAKKRKKVDRSKLNQDEQDEAEMDVEELARKDLKERLLQQDKEGVVKVDGRVNESISMKYPLRAADNQVTLEDANYWLLSQKPYIRPKLFVRAEAARIVTKSLL